MKENFFIRLKKPIFSCWFCLFFIINYGETDYFVFGQEGEDTDQQVLADKLGQFKHVSMLFASQNLISPISSFGHTLLIFHNEVTPEPDSIIFEYLGDTEVSYYAIRGLLWTIPGGFHLLPWSQKRWIYEREDRDIWAIRLKLEKHERQKLESNIKAFLSQIEPYNFFFNNCSWYIFEIVKESMDDMECSVKPYVLPIETLNALYKCKKTGESVYIPSHATRLSKAFKKLDRKEKSILKNLDVEDNFHYEDISVELKTAITEWVDYKIPRTNREDYRNKLFKLKKIYHHPVQLENKKLEELNRLRSGRITLSYLTKWRSTTLTISPAQVRFLNALEDPFWADRFEFMTVGFTFIPKKFFLSKFNVIDINTNTSGHVLKVPFVRDIYLGYQKYTIDSRQYWSEFLARVGSGLVHDFHDHWKLSILAFLESGMSADRQRSYFLARFGIGAVMSVRLLSWLRSKIEVRQMIGYNSLIGQVGKGQLVFLDKRPFVGALEYLFFSTVKDRKFHHSLGFSLSYLF